MPSVTGLLSYSEKAAHLSSLETQHVNTGHLEKSELISEEFSFQKTMAKTLSNLLHQLMDLSK